MYYITTKKILLCGIAVLLMGLVLAREQIGNAAAYLNGWLFPRDIELYVVDQRVEGDFAKDLDLLYPSADQRRDGVRVVIHRVGKEQVVGAIEPLLDRFAETQNAGEASLLFIELPPPYCDSKKVLRQGIDKQARFTGENRVALLRNLIALVGARPESETYNCQRADIGPQMAHGTAPKYRDACKLLEDDWVYLKTNYGGLGLMVDDQTISLVGKCLPGLLAKIAYD